MLKNYNPSDVEIVSGMAKGADSLGVQYAKERGMSVKEFPAKWDDFEGKDHWEIGRTKYGKSYWKKAGTYRNSQMAYYADACIAFWDGKSTGTGDMIRQAKENELKLKIYEY